MTLYLNRKEQSEYLKERGIRYSPNTLQKLATIGGGPRYVIIGNRAMSTIEWLEDWIEQRTSKTNTSEVQPALPPKARGKPSSPRPDLRDHFAGQALVGILASGPYDRTPDEITHDAYRYADAMLKAREATE